MMAIYINTETMQYPLYEGDVRLAFPNVSLPRVDFVAPEPFYAVAPTSIPEFDIATQAAREVMPSFISNEWVQTWEVYELSSEELAQRTEQKANEVRNERNKKLTASDWTQVDDTPLSNSDKIAWAQYRQALRDLPSQEGFPWNVIWPEKV